MPSAQTVQSTTQQFLDIFDITNNLVIMKDGSTSLILTVNAINFGLFAEEEQDAVIYAYAGLLNSLNYSIQIVVRSQTKDVTAYLRLLQDQEEQTPDEGKRQRIRRYREFVGNLIREGNVLDKKFYVVIPASALEMGLLTPQSVVPGVKTVDISQVERSQILEKAKNILEPKRDHLISQFARIGLQAHQLSTQEIIQLFYTTYNPEATEGQEVTDTKSYTTPVVSAAVQTGLMNTLQATQPVAPATPEPVVPTAPQVAPVMPVAAVPAPTMTSPEPATPMVAATPTPAIAPEPAPLAPTMTATVPGSFEPPAPVAPITPAQPAPPTQPVISAVPPAVSNAQPGDPQATSVNSDALPPLPEI